MSLEQGESTDVDQQAQDRFVRLLSKHSSALYGFILALAANQHDADDIFQETNVVLLRKWQTFEEGSDFLAWSCTIARYKTMTHHSRYRRGNAPDAALIEALSEKALDAARSADERREALLECVEKLSPADVRLIQSRYYHKYSVGEIAKMQGMSSARVYRLLSTIHRSLHQCVQRSLGGANG
jgi:RNA polymerase sigma-70 factor (ECF subfamily)